MRKVSHFTLILLTLFSLCKPLIAQDGYTDSPVMKYEDRTYRSYIKTVQLHQVGWKFSPPSIEMNAGQQLQLDFDDLQGDFKSYYYTFIHCDADWTPSDINNFDYLKGYEQDFLTNYATSFGTTQGYTHYTLVFPNNNIQLLLSGNYLLKVYLNNNPDSVILTRRFMLYRDKLIIHPRETPGIGDEMFTKQEIVFSINTTRYNIMDPFHALRIFIQQNGRWDNIISDVQPQFVQDTSLQYYSDFGNMFDGGNQFRNFDMTTLHLISDQIQRFVPGKEEEIDLKPDKPRGSLPYITLPDIDGQFYILDKDADSTPINGEYVRVHFFMPYDSAITTGNVYIFGGLSDWQCKKEFRMHYVDSLNGYAATLYLKQGFYDYQYAYLKDKSTVADVTPFEGNHSETENTYTIYAYYRPPGLYYDELIGIKTFHAPSN
jgi:hypothetical protein